MTTKFLNRKNKYYTMYFSPTDLHDFDKFLDIISSTIEYDKRYSILIRVCYLNKSLNQTTDWKSLGEQVGLRTDGQDKLFEFIKSFQRIIIDRIELCMDMYNFEDIDVMGIQLLMYNVNYTPIVVKPTKFNTESLGEHKNLVNVSKVSEGFNKLIPLTSDVSKFGILLNKYVSNNVVEYITLLDGSKINFLYYINNYLENKINNISGDTNFYILDNNKIITVKSCFDSNTNDINVYNINGMKICNIKDIIQNKDSFIRKIGNVSGYIDSSGIYKKDISLNFDTVYPNKITGYQSKLIHPDWMVGTLDVETYKLNDRTSKIYAIGFCTENSLNTFYIDKDLDSNKIVINCLDTMLTDKYNKFSFYVHNFGRFDVIFILKIIIKANQTNGNKYEYKIFFRDDNILSLNISVKVNKKTYTIKLIDSYNLLQSSLHKLCKTFDTDVKKTIFPYEFINKNNLFYIGNKPEFKYYNTSIEDYKKISVNNWSVQKETIYYLENDLLSLLNVINKFKNKMYIDYHTHITRSLTISGLAMDIFLRRYHNNNIPLINRKPVYNDIKQSYYGGITEVYKPHGKNLYYYDVNSLYPYSALKTMPGLNCVYSDKINLNINQCDDKLFGFYYCKIKTSNNYLGLLPVRSNESIIMPLGEFEGWYFSEELKFASKYGYSIDIIYGYTFDKTEGVFNKYVEEFYKIKSNSIDKTERSIAKSLLNNLLGRFGMDTDKFVTELVSEDRYLEILQYKRVKSIKHIGDKILLTYGSDVSLDICKSHDVDFKETFNNDFTHRKNKVKGDVYHDVSIAISSAVTAYSRIYMNTIKMYILDKGGSIYYTDTDSIVTDIKLENDYIGNEIGKFKLEHEINEAYFISSKTYCLKTKSGDIIIKAKGVNDVSLSYENFEDLYNSMDIDTYRNETVRDYSEGSVTLNVPKKVTIKSDAYKKRSKLYNNNLWIDTKPITISTNKQSSYSTLSRVNNFINKVSYIRYFLSIIKYVFTWLVFIIMILSITMFDIGGINYIEDIINMSDIHYKIEPNNISDSSIDYNQIDCINKNNLDNLNDKPSDKTGKYNWFKEFKHSKGIQTFENSNKRIFRENVDILTDKREKNSDILIQLEKQNYENALKKIERQNVIISLLQMKSIRDDINQIDNLNIYKSILDEFKDLNNKLSEYRE